MLRLAALTLAALITSSPSWAQAPSNTGCADAKSAAAPGRPTSGEGAAAGAGGKGSDVGVVKDGPGTTGWSSGNSEAGIQKDGKAPAAEAKQPETAKGLDPTKRPC